MYITVKSIKRNLGFKGIEVADLIIGVPLFFLILLLFSFSSLRLFAVILFVISVFMFIPISLSKKNRMYKILFLFFNYLRKEKEYIFFKDERKENKLNAVFRYKCKN